MKAKQAHCPRCATWVRAEKQTYRPGCGDLLLIGLTFGVWAFVIPAINLFRSYRCWRCGQRV